MQGHANNRAGVDRSDLVLVLVRLLEERELAQLVSRVWIMGQASELQPKARARGARGIGRHARIAPRCVAFR